MSEEDKRENMERLVREELDKWETNSMREFSPAPGTSGYRSGSRIGSSMGGIVRLFTIILKTNYYYLCKIYY